MKIHCEILAPVHSQQYRALRLDSLKRHPECFGSGYEAQRKLPKLYFEGLIESASRESVMIGAFFGEELIGICGLTPARQAGAMEIIQMYVSERYRRQSVGLRLLSQAKLVLQTRIERQLVLTVFSDNHAAIWAYEKFGFSRVDVTDNDIFMTLSV